MTFPFPFSPHRPVGFETSKSYVRRWQEGFWQRWIKGPKVVDIGYRGGVMNALPLFEGVIGIELGEYGYDGRTLPFEDNEVDTVYSSHVLEHVAPTWLYLKEWFRVIREGGTLIIVVPSAYLYERRLTVPPSRWSPEHLRSFTPASLLDAVNKFAPNSYRIRALFDDDTGYDYSLPIEQHPTGVFEIVCVLEKISLPAWWVEV